MRRLADRQLIEEFMRALAREAAHEARVYFTGGATAVLSGWRASTIDVDLLVRPESDALFRAFPRLKESLEINLELASPADFVPELPGWEARSRFIGREGSLSFFHYDFYAQALSKLERGHVQDLDDVKEMVERGLVDRSELRRLFSEIEPHLHRYPAIDPPTFRRAVEEVAGP